MAYKFYQAWYHYEDAETDVRTLVECETRKTYGAAFSDLKAMRKEYEKSADGTPNSHREISSGVGFSEVALPGGISVSGPTRKPPPLIN